MTKKHDNERTESGEDVKYVAILCFQFGVYFPCSADYEQDRQPYPGDDQSAGSDDHTHTHPCHLLNSTHTTAPATASIGGNE